MSIGGFDDNTQGEDFRFTEKALLSCNNLLLIENGSMVYSQHAGVGKANNTYMMPKRIEAKLYGNPPHSVESPEWVTVTMLENLIAAEQQSANNRGMIPGRTVNDNQLPKLSPWVVGEQRTLRMHPKCCTEKDDRRCTMRHVSEGVEHTADEAAKGFHQAASKTDQNFTSTQQSCGLNTTIWSLQNGDGNTGACQGGNAAVVCPELVPNPTVTSRWACDGLSSISLNMSGMNAEVCSSFSTKDSCSFKQNGIKGIQASLTSSGCHGLWVAPLWMAPQTWIPPQHATGEIDIFERGCWLTDGYVLAFGENETYKNETYKYVRKDAWGEEGKPAERSAYTVYLDFRPDGKDQVDSYLCPLGTTPIRGNPLDWACKKTSTRENYYADSAGETMGGEGLFHLVSDVWNACASKSLCNANHGSKYEVSSNCEFTVTDIKLKFNEGYFFAHGHSDVCSTLTDW
jgi:hypothetical protein